jgi:hypothetical protein
MSTLDLMLLPFELILVGATAWCAIVLVSMLTKDIIEAMRTKHLQR